MKSSLSLLLCLCASYAFASSKNPTYGPEPHPIGPRQQQCDSDSSDVFNIMVDFDPTSVKRDNIFPRQDDDSSLVSPSSVADSSSSLPSCTGTPVLTLKSGVLTDQLSRICSITSNNQFQCDPAPGQVNAIRTSGWSICEGQPQRGLKISDSEDFWLCKSRDPDGKREFFNIYDHNLPSPPSQCTQGRVKVFPCSNTTSSTGSGDGQMKRNVLPWIEQSNSGQEQAQGAHQKRSFEQGDIQGAALAPAPAAAVKRNDLPTQQQEDHLLGKRAPFPLNHGGKMWLPMQPR